MKKKAFFIHREILEKRKKLIVKNTELLFFQIKSLILIMIKTDVIKYSRKTPEILQYEKG